MLGGMPLVECPNCSTKVADHITYCVACDSPMPKSNLESMIAAAEASNLIKSEEEDKPWPARYAVIGLLVIYIFWVEMRLSELGEFDEQSLSARGDYAGYRHSHWEYAGEDHDHVSYGRLDPEIDRAVDGVVEDAIRRHQARYH